MKQYVARSPRRGRATAHGGTRGDTVGSRARLDARELGLVGPRARRVVELGRHAVAVLGVAQLEDGVDGVVVVVELPRVERVDDRARVLERAARALLGAADPSGVE